jgi:SAM-dependent methyltransferase
MSTESLSSFTHLAEFYQKAGFARYSEQMMPRIVQHLQETGWIGRRVLDLGCGVGTATLWLAQQGFRASGVDLSAAMLAKARINAEAAGLGMIWRQQDIRSLEYGGEGTLDLATAFGVVNYIGDSEELESTFAGVYRALAPERILAFDLFTIQGLAEYWGTQNHIPYDNQQDLTVIIRSHFSYESLRAILKHIIFHHDGINWQRAEEVHALYGYHFQVIDYLLKRVGFADVEILSSDLTPINGDGSGESRVIFVARKLAA